MQASERIPSGEELVEAIRRLRSSANAVILAHYYQESEIQDLADFVGDSLQLAQQAKKTSADLIVFCGVHFMAETAKILNPTRKVVVPDLEAGCSLADGCPPAEFRAFLDRHPGHTVVSYINCSAAVKAMSDVICTSSNAVRIVEQLPADTPIVFAPDRHLGRFVAKKTGRDLVLWPGTCIVHEVFSEQRLLALRLRHPEAQVVAHPECDESVLRHADFIGSTKALIEQVAASDGRVFIVATEEGILHAMGKRAPGKLLLQAPGEDESCACNRCPHMRRNTMEKLYLCLRDQRPELDMPEELRLGALRPIERMLEMSC
jgi:quinolinate synthase